MYIYIRILIFTKKQLVIHTINQYERIISTQVLNEFCNVCIRKLKMPISAVRDSITEIKNICDLIIVDDDTIVSALGCHEKYGYSFYDSLMMASALESGCAYLLSEDMADGQIIEGNLTIKNIFIMS
ncbi:MAG: PIN domain-containing protein [Oscillospiraceae bacterium]|nr:PIN domain-containing protein [Oscillospiraceae bacterium]